MNARANISERKTSTHSEYTKTSEIKWQDEVFSRPTGGLFLDPEEGCSLRLSQKSTFGPKGDFNICKIFQKQESA